MATLQQCDKCLRLYRAEGSLSEVTLAATDAEGDLVKHVWLCDDCLEKLRTWIKPDAWMYAPTVEDEKPLTSDTPVADNTSIKPPSALPTEIGRWTCPHCGYGEYKSRSDWEERFANHLAVCPSRPSVMPDDSPL